ncbi:retroviral-like aspartic protease family protein [Flavobacterium agricola]|uniref:Retroviral-like aspartic protease family protein n=1 Tax=Flavobacterium agricola TaxID=2870839 RepID=A0ABY6M3F3_9FLAO|nr:retropepsin-like aspartic protease [Flavobacterium agricola]UYW02274.1 retroviral-like aspartic protease family protein [Flavobacterium agricola]
MKKVFVLVALFFIQFALAQSDDERTGGSFTPTSFYQVVPFVFENNQIKIPVTIEGEIFTFLFDTGAPLAISKTIQQKYNYKELYVADLSDANGKKDTVTIVKVPEIKLGDITFYNTEGLKMEEDASEFFKCLGIDGIFGANMLVGKIVQLDMQNKHLIFTTDITKLHASDIPYKSLEFDDQNSPFVDVTLKNGANEIAESVIFDTGVASFFDLAIAQYQWYEKYYPMASVFAETFGALSWSYTGFEDPNKQYIYKIPELSINGTAFTNVLSVGTYDRASRLGLGILDYGTVTLDYVNKRFYYTPLPDLFVFKNQLLQAFDNTITKNGLFVSAIWNKELEDKINIGDQVLAYNNISYQNKTMCELINFKHVTQKKNNVIRFKDVKTGKVKKVKIAQFYLNE